MLFTFPICTREEAFDYEKVYKRVAHYAGENWGEKLFSTSVVENNKAIFIMRLKQGTLEAEVENGWVYIQGDKVDFVDHPITAWTLENFQAALNLTVSFQSAPARVDSRVMQLDATKTPFSKKIIQFRFGNSIANSLQFFEFQI